MTVQGRGGRGRGASAGWNIRPSNSGKGKVDFPPSVN